MDNNGIDETNSQQEEIGNFNDFPNPNLQNNRLSELPDEIEDLDNLLYLNLQGNQLSELPEKIGRIYTPDEIEKIKHRNEGWGIKESIESVSEKDINQNNEEKLAGLTVVMEHHHGISSLTIGQVKQARKESKNSEIKAANKTNKPFKKRRNTI